jgi:hypothetical protein
VRSSALLGRQLGQSAVSAITENGRLSAHIADLVETPGSNCWRVRLACLPGGKRLNSSSHRCKWRLTANEACECLAARDKHGKHSHKTFLKAGQAGGRPATKEVPATWRGAALHRAMLGLPRGTALEPYFVKYLVCTASRSLTSWGQPRAANEFCGDWPTFAWFATKVGPNVEIAATECNIGQPRVIGWRASIGQWRRWSFPRPGGGLM